MNLSGPLQRDEDTPAICKNENCTNFQAFELYPIEEVKTDTDGKDYVNCYECKEKVYLR